MRKSDKSKQRSYPSQRADALERYVKYNIPLSRTAHHLYAAARWLEMEKASLCGRVVAGFEELAAAARIDEASVKPALLEMQEKGVMAVKIGSPIKKDGKATEFRRLTLAEIKTHLPQECDAHRLAKELTSHPFMFEGELKRPCWNAGHTGRVCSKHPNFQGLPANRRVQGLMQNVGPGRMLVCADIKQAEPTIIKHILGFPKETDLYALLMEAAGVDRQKSKDMLNALAYSRNTQGFFSHWPDRARSDATLGSYADHLHRYKQALLKDVRKSRTVTTLTGRRVAAEKGMRLHAGMPFNWRVQGTVADIINPVCLALLDISKVVIPMHDAIYAVLPDNSDTAFVADLITVRAREIGIAVSVQTEVKYSR